jgi:hypothetical protein
VLLQCSGHQKRENEEALNHQKSLFPTAFTGLRARLPYFLVGDITRASLFVGKMRAQTRPLHQLSSTTAAEPVTGPVAPVLCSKSRMAAKALVVKLPDASQYAKPLSKQGGTLLLARSR